MNGRRNHNSIPMKYDANLGTWYDPRTWFTPSASQVKTPPIVPSTNDAVVVAPPPPSTSIPDDFLAPGAQEQIDLDAMAASRKNYMILAGILAVVLLVVVGRKKNEKA